MFIRRGLAYRNTEETDLLRSKWGPVDWEGCGVLQNGGNGLVLERYSRNRGLVHREGRGIPQNRTPRDTIHRHHRLPPRATIHSPSTSSSLHLRLFIHGLMFIQPPPRAPPPATVQPALSTGPIQPPLHGILFISAVDCLHELLFIHRRPPPASTCDCSSTGSCSSSLHRALLHRLLFNQHSPRGPVEPPLHGLLFIQPSTGTV